MSSISNKRIDNTRGSNDAKIELVSVSEALRRHVGKMRVEGMLISLTKLFKMITGIKFYCDKCQELTEVKYPFPVYNIINEDKKCIKCNFSVKCINYEYCNAVEIELQDRNSFNDLDRLSAFLFDEDTENVQVGETVTVVGQIQIDEPRKNIKKLMPHFYAESIHYNRNPKVILNEVDVAAIRRFTHERGPRIIESLVSMFDKSIIGNEEVKKGLLLCAVNSNSDSDVLNYESNKLLRERLHALLIGPPGLAKSRLLKSITKLVYNSRYESGQNSSGKSLTAIVSKEEENYVLRLGPVSLSKNSICAINEFGRTTFEDQAHFLDIMEEGEYTINKYGINAGIKSPTTIIASANPLNHSSWTDEDIIDTNEIPALKPIVDRFDLIFVFRNNFDENNVREYAYEKSELQSRLPPDYSNYLGKHIEYAKKIQPRISDEARIMLVEYFINIRSKDFGSNRILETLFRLSKAFARLKLKFVVDEKEAMDTIEYYNTMLQNFKKIETQPISPRIFAYNKCASMLKDFNSEIKFEDLVTKICEDNYQLKRYFDSSNKSLKIQNNRKIRGLYEMLIKHPSVKIINEKPASLQWIVESSH